MELASNPELWWGRNNLMQAVCPVSGLEHNQGLTRVSCIFNSQFIDNDTEVQRGTQSRGEPGLTQVLWLQILFLFHGIIPPSQQCPLVFPHQHPLSPSAVLGVFLSYVPCWSMESPGGSVYHPHSAFLHTASSSLLQPQYLSNWPHHGQFLISKTVCNSHNIKLPKAELNHISLLL